MIILVLVLIYLGKEFLSLVWWLLASLETDQAASASPVVSLAVLADYLLPCLACHLIEA